MAYSNEHVIGLTHDQGKELNEITLALSRLASFKIQTTRDEGVKK